MEPTNIKDLFDKLTEVSVTQATIIANQTNQSRTLDKHSDLLERQSETLIRNTATVEEHHKRSTYLEDRQEKLESEFEIVKQTVLSDKQKKVWWRDLMRSIGTVTTVLSAMGGGLYAAYQFLKSIGF